MIEQAYAFIWGSSEQLPVEIVRSRPRLCLAYAKTLFMVAPYTTMERWHSDAETALRGELLAPMHEAADTGASSAIERHERDNLLGEIAASRAIITGYYQGDGHATLALCQEAITHLAEENLLTRAEVAYAQSLAHHSFGDIVAAIQCAREATTLAQAAGDISSTILYLNRTAYSLLLCGKLHEAVQVTEQATLLGTTPVGLQHAMVCWGSIFHADVLREWNRLDEALDLILQAVRLSEQTETVVALYLGYTELMRIYLARREMEAARSAFQHAEEVLEKTFSPYRRDAYLIVDWVQYWLASGESERATHWVRELVQQSRVQSPFAREREDVAHARILLAQKKPMEALALLEPLGAGAEKQERWSHVIEIKVLQALAHSMGGEEQEAFTLLAQALQLAEPEGYIRRFVDEGSPMAILLTGLRNQQRKHGLTPYVDTVLAAFGQGGTTPEHLPEAAGQRTTVHPLLDPLSERELEVLHLLVQGNSNQEIAEGLVITIDTVKRHVSNIYSKLGVHTRVQAVARARALGLLSEEP